MGLVRLAQVLAEVSGGEGFADVRRVEDAAGGGDDLRTLLHAACGEGHVRGNADVARFDALGDPVIGGVKGGASGDLGDMRLAARAHAARRDERDPRADACGHADRFVLYGAGIGIDVDMHGGSVGRWVRRDCLRCR